MPSGDARSGHHIDVFCQSVRRAFGVAWSAVAQNQR
jgi:hypothetical protein